MIYRTAILCVIFLFSSYFLHAFDMQHSMPIKKPLHTFPEQIGNWRSNTNQSLDENVIGKLKVDDYLFRNYYGSNGSKISLYASYFSHTDNTKGYHSPLNCMPGSGWNIARTKPVAIEIRNNVSETVNRLTLQNGSQKQIALYWYQCRGRIIHNEYWERIYRVIDSLWRQRTDGAFVRIILHQSPDPQALSSLKRFASEIIPLLDNYFPE